MFGLIYSKLYYKAGQQPGCWPGDLGGGLQGCEVWPFQKTKFGLFLIGWIEILLFSVHRDLSQGYYFYLPFNLWSRYDCPL